MYSQQQKNCNEAADLCWFRLRRFREFPVLRSVKNTVSYHFKEGLLVPLSASAVSAESYSWFHYWVKDIW